MGDSSNPFLMYDYTLNHNGTEVPFARSAASDYKTDVITRISREFVTAAAPSRNRSTCRSVHGPPRGVGDRQPRRQLRRQAPRPAARRRLCHGTDAAGTELRGEGCLDKPSWVQALANIGTSRTEVLTGKYRTQLASLASVDEGIRQIVQAVAAAGRARQDRVRVHRRQRLHPRGASHRIPRGVIYEPSIRSLLRRRSRLPEGRPGDHPGHVPRTSHRRSSGWPGGSRWRSRWMEPGCRMAGAT